MTTVSTELTLRPEWLALHRHFTEIGRLHLRALFAADPARAGRFSAEAAGLYLDYSRQRITTDTRRLLCELAEACALPRHMAAMFRGDPINTTEHRAALHVALRAPAGEQIRVGGRDVVADVHEVLTRMEQLLAIDDSVVNDLYLTHREILTAAFAMQARDLGRLIDDFDYAEALSLVRNLLAAHDTNTPSPPDTPPT